MPNAASLAAVARTNEYLRRALDEYPEYARAVELRAAVVQAQRELRGVGAVSSPDDAAGLDEFLTSVEQRTLDELAFEAKRRALMSLRGEIDNRLSSVITVHGDAILTSLASQFATLMEEVGSVAAELHGATTAGDAIARGTENAWRKLPELRDQYDRLRAAQQTVVLFAFDPQLLATSRSHHIEDELASDLHLANLDQVLPGWKRPDNRAATTLGELGDRRPWPIDDPLAQLVWMVTSNARPWLPTAKDLGVLRAKRQARAAKAGPKPQPVRDQSGLMNKPIDSRDRLAPTWRAVPTHELIDVD